MAGLGERSGQPGYRGAAHPPVQTLNPVQSSFRASFIDKLRAGEYWLENVDACVCGGQSSRRIADHDRFGIPVGVVVCSACGLARTSPRLAADCLPAFYESDYHGLHMGEPKPDPSIALYRKGQGSAIFARVEDLLPRVVRVAEVGCGTGQVLREFEVAARAAGHTVLAIGCEYASAYVQAGRAAGSDIRIGGPSALAPDSPFDLVILSHVVEHFADLQSELAGVSRLVPPSAVAYVEVPGLLAIHHKPEYEFEFPRYFTLAHTFHFSLATLAYVMRKGGFELLRGDEEARTIFRRSGSPVTAQIPQGSAEVLNYLAWLESSPSMRLRRLALRSRRRARSVARVLLRTALGARAYRSVREVGRRLRIVT